MVKKKCVSIALYIFEVSAHPTRARQEVGQWHRRVVSTETLVIAAY